ncbi:acetyl-CoA carboxylase carboxyltransferase subunit alpha [Actinomadura sp. NTSP31]|uniref:acetyl-CoA carboxylase carboxyltransferase subunit alpha n=1 Tax=Actinomadura sp. NTSP31 TaxID=1735447 RepID=UPI0035BFA69C
MAARNEDWTACPGCRRLLYSKRLEREHHVCRECGHVLRVGARRRIELLADPGTFAEFGAEVAGRDPLGFADRRSYAERLAEAAEATGEREAVVCGTAELHGRPVVLAVLDFSFMGGSMGTGAGEKVALAAERSLRDAAPLIVVTASGGARMQEGILSLLQMAKTAQAMARLHEAGVLSVCLLTDPTYGGVSASFAMLGGIVLAESQAMVGFAGPRVVEQTIRQQLPPGFQTSEFLLEHGLVDRVVPRAETRSLLGRLLALHERAPGAAAAGAVAPRRPREADPWQVVQEARDGARPTALDYLRDAFDDFVELHGDRAFADDPAIVAGVARIEGRPVVVIGHQKGHDTKELIARNFGMPHPEGHRKALRMLDHAARYRLPVVTLIDTAGAFPGVEAEERGQSAAIAELIMRSSRLPVPIVSVVTGEGGSGGALALATGDRLLMLERSFYSVISPEGCAAILWRSPQAAPQAARALRITAGDLLELGVADGVVAEPAGGAGAEPLAMAGILRHAVLTALARFDGADPGELVAARHERFRRIGSLPAVPTGTGTHD